MAQFRTLLACLIALAVAIAPVAVTLVAGANPAGASAAHDCHGAASKHHHMAGCPDGGAMRHHCHDAALTDDGSAVTDKGSCPDCDGKRPAKCVDNGKCCQLTGIVAMVPAMIQAVQSRDVVANEPVLTGWLMRPAPPPPRT